MRGGTGRACCQVDRHTFGGPSVVSPVIARAAIDGVVATIAAETLKFIVHPAGQVVGKLGACDTAHAGEGDRAQWCDNAAAAVT